MSKESLTFFVCVTAILSIAVKLVGIGFASVKLDIFIDGNVICCSILSYLPSKYVRPCIVYSDKLFSSTEITLNFCVSKLVLVNK